MIISLSILTNNSEGDYSLLTTRLATVVTTVGLLDGFDDEGGGEVFFLRIYPGYE